MYNGLFLYTNNFFYFLKFHFLETIQYPSYHTGGGLQRDIDVDFFFQMIFGPPGSGEFRGECVGGHVGSNFRIFVRGRMCVSACGNLNGRV